MRKTFLLIALTVLSSHFVMAQVGEGQIEFSGLKRTVKQMEVRQEPEVVEQAVKNRMAKSGYKSKEVKGWLMFKDVSDLEISAERCDFYVKTEKKSRKEKDVSMVYFFASRPGAHAEPSPLAPGMLVADGFQSQITALADAHKLELDIIAQEELTKKAEKKRDDLEKEQASLEKKIKNLQDELETNKQKQTEQASEIENLRRTLESLKAQRKG